MKYLFYEDWTEKRVNTIIDYFGKEWFYLKNILELGACHGDIGLQFLKLGSHVTFSDVRLELLKNIRDRLQQHYNYNALTKQINNNFPWVYDEKVDLILHLGLLYNIKNWKEDLSNCFRYTNQMILESKVDPVSNYQDPENIYPIHPIYGPYKTSESNFTDIEVEHYLKSIGCEYTRLNNEKLNSRGWIHQDYMVHHIYVWDENNYKSFKPILYKNLFHFRRMWYVKKTEES